jgi:hypothetical protein
LARAQTLGSGHDIRFVVGRGSAPSDPRLSYHIGNPGIRKQAKIRKMAKPESSHHKTDRRRASVHSGAWNLWWKSKQMADRRAIAR